MKKIILILSFSVSAFSFADAQYIYTVAGTGSNTASGDGGPATAAGIDNVKGIAVDDSGNFYMADLGGYIRKVNKNGIISTVAGSSNIAAFKGDGGQATAAVLSTPWGVAIDKAGNIFIADEGNGRIRKVDTKGVINTVAGGGGFVNTGDGGPATAAGLGPPYGVALDDSDNIYIAVGASGLIRKVNQKGIITTIMNGGGAFPIGITVDHTGNVYFADYNDNGVYKLSPLGVKTTVAGGSSGSFSGDGGQGTAAKLNQPYGVGLDAFGNIFIADTYNHRIRMINSSGIISTVAGDGTGGFSGDGGLAINAELYYPSAVEVDALGNVFIADNSNLRIREIINGSASISELGNKLDVNIYPMPSNGRFSVQIGNNYQIKSASQIDIYDLLGQKVYSQVIETTQSNLSLNLNLNNGIYILRLMTDKGVVSKKIEIVR